MTKMDTEDFIGNYCEITTDDDDETVWTVTDEAKASDEDFYLVNTSGAMVKSKSAAKDGEDYKFTVSGYEITKVTLDN